jgi:hypothetical protein
MTKQILIKPAIDGQPCTLKRRNAIRRPERRMLLHCVEIPLPPKKPVHATDNNAINHHSDSNHHQPNFSQ